MLSSTKKLFAAVSEQEQRIEIFARELQRTQRELRLVMKQMELDHKTIEPGHVVFHPFGMPVVVNVERVERFKARLEAASVRDKLRFGERVGYLPPWTENGIVWRGVIIPRPKGYPQFSTRSHGLLTYIVRDGDRAIRGCFSSNLVRL